jgi:N utilization substance protein B
VTQPKTAPKNKRRRGRELALHALCTLDGKHPGFNVTLFRLRERALIAEIELCFVDGDKAGAEAAVAALLTLDSKHALGLEYQRALAGKAPLPVPPGADERIELEATRGTSDELEFAETLTRGVTDHKDEVDKLLTAASVNWRVARMAMVDRNILRLATFELSHLSDIPPRVILNEAIEIGKRYGTSDSGAFINGILDKIATQVRGFPGQLGGIRSPSDTPDE